MPTGGLYPEIHEVMFNNPEGLLNITSCISDKALVGYNIGWIDSVPTPYLKSKCKPLRANGCSLRSGAHNSGLWAPAEVDVGKSLVACV